MIEDEFVAGLNLDSLYHFCHVSFIMVNNDCAWHLGDTSKNMWQTSFLLTSLMWQWTHWESIPLFIMTGSLQLCLRRPEIAYSCPREGGHAPNFYSPGPRDSWIVLSGSTFLCSKEKSVYGTRRSESDWVAEIEGKWLKPSMRRIVLT